MRVIMFKDRFRELILSGEKSHTIRKKARCRPGDVLSLRSWTGRPYRSKQETFATRICSEVIALSMDEGRVLMDGVPVAKAMQEALAKKDGFECFKDMEEFFKATHGLPFDGELIRWTPKEVSS
jgi:uncharacterized protein YqfB (UPF0267 family)